MRRRRRRRRRRQMRNIGRNQVRKDAGKRGGGEYGELREGGV